jgi:hypothetical protein
VLRTTPAPENLAPYYATDLAGTMTRPESRVFAALRRLQLGRELRRIVRHGAPGTFLDVGCGPGDFVRLLARKGFDAIGADGAREPPPALSSAPSLPYLRFDFDTYEVDGLDPGGSYTVILRHVLEHVREPQLCLARLRAQGARRFFVVVPNAASLERRLFGADWYLWDPPRHLWHFDALSLDALCRRAGLKALDHGHGTAPSFVPSLYRRLRLRGYPAALYRHFGPTSILAALTAPLNLLVPGNVLWVIAEEENEAR